MTFVFTKQQRLHATEIDLVFKQGRRFKTGSFLFIYRHVDNDPNKLGLIIAKKKLKTAVSRNLTKRIVRENFRLAQNDCQHYHIIALANKPGAKINRKELHQCCQEFFQYLASRSKRDAIA